MSELLAWDGPWSKDLIELMLPIAVEIETKREQAFARAVIAGVASFSSASVWSEYSRTLEEVHEKIRKDLLVQRGLSEEEIDDISMQKFIAGLMKLRGLKRR